MTPAGALDLRGDVHVPGPPPWLRSRLERTLDRLGAPPDPAAAVRAVAARHDRSPDELLLTAGTSEAVLAVARSLPPCRALCVHPRPAGLTEALRAAGHDVVEPVLAAPWVLGPADVPDDVDLVVLGPAGPAGVLRHPLGALCRPGRVVVVDASLADAVPDEVAPVADDEQLPGLAVVRGTSAVWGLAGLPAGYLLADPELVERARCAQPPGTVSSPALVALETCAGRGPVRAAEKLAQERELRRVALAGELRRLGVDVSAGAGPFLLCRVPGGQQVVAGLAERGVLVRAVAVSSSAQDGHWTAAVPDEDGAARLVAALAQVLGPD